MEVLTDLYVLLKCLGVAQQGDGRRLRQRDQRVCAYSGFMYITKTEGLMVFLKSQILAFDLIHAVTQGLSTCGLSKRLM